MKLLIRAVKNHHNMFICNTMHLIIKRTNPWFNSNRHNRQINTSSSSFSGYLEKNISTSLSDLTLSTRRTDISVSRYAGWKVIDIFNFIFHHKLRNSYSFRYDEAPGLGGAWGARWRRK